jgi:uncharacterized metal-binding protein
MKIPKIGLLVYNSGSSNSGTLTGIAAMEVVKELGSDLVGICSLPALANEIPRQVLTVKKLEHLIVIDGCSNSCARNLANKSLLSRMLHNDHRAGSLSKPYKRGFWRMYG